MAMPRGNRKLTAAIVIMAGFQIAACDYSAKIEETKVSSGSTPKGVLRKKRYVVEVNTPQGVVTGYSVIGFRVDCVKAFPGESCGLRESSEAAAVQLPNGKTLFALLSSHGQPQHACCAPAYAWKEGQSAEYSEYKATQYPDLVVFGDNKDRMSAQPIDTPENFGDGYSIKRIYTESTDLPLTNNVLKILPWMPDIKDRCLSGKGFCPNDGKGPDRHNALDFIERETDAK